MDFVLFIAFPYVAVIIAVGMSLFRYFTDRYSYSSQSSEFLEGRTLFWGSVPWHYAILVILLAHVVALIIPSLWADFINAPIRLYALEVTGLALALTAFLALVTLVARRIRYSKVRMVTSPMDWVLLALLIAQIGLGFWTAIAFRWGADWYVATAVPWIWSLFKLNPDISTVTAMPLVVKLHFLGGFLIIAIFPFTRLVHMVTVPIAYLWRPYQLVIWNKKRQREQLEALTHPRRKSKI